MRALNLADAAHSQPDDFELQRRQRAAALDERILQLIRLPSIEDGAFERLALAVFEHQFQYNEPYHRFCLQRARTPAGVGSWREIPAFAASSFAHARLAAFPPARASLIFCSSGTTGGSGSRSRHELENGELYDASLLSHFRRCVLPDRYRMPMVLFAPSFDEAPESSLSYMLQQLFDRCADGGGFFIAGDQLRFDAAAETLQAAIKATLIFGTAFALVHFMDRCAAQGLRFALPPGSRIVETGGFKGKSRAVEPGEFYDALTRTFGVPRAFCISEYGMCELGSQWYDANLADVLAGRSPRLGLKIAPHWARALIMDPISGHPSAAAEGLLGLFDLSNRGSVMAVLSADRARAAEDGFVYLGRSAGAAPKGCSITADALLSGRHA